MTNTNYITTKEARRITRCNVSELRRLLTLGAIKAVRKENRGWFVDKESAEAFSKVLNSIVKRRINEYINNDIEDE